MSFSCSPQDGESERQGFKQKVSFLSFSVDSLKQILVQANAEKTYENERNISLFFFSFFLPRLCRKDSRRDRSRSRDRKDKEKDKDRMKEKEKKDKKKDKKEKDEKKKDSKVKRFYEDLVLHRG